MYYRPEQLVFIDESAKDERSIARGYGYSQINTRAVKKIVFVRGIRYTICPALTLQGIIAVDIVEGNYTKPKFMDFIINKVVCAILIIIRFTLIFWLSLNSRKLFSNRTLT